MAATYTMAPDVKDVAEELIEDRFPDIRDNPDVTLEYVFIDPAPKSKGQIILGTMRKVSSLTAFFRREGKREAAVNRPFFTMVISRKFWENMTGHEREALVDHELRHCGVRINDVGETELYIIGHDLEEFAATVERYGLWRKDMKPMADAFAKHNEQIPLPFSHIESMSISRDAIPGLRRAAEAMREISE